MIGARRREYSEARWPAEPSDEEPLASDDAPLGPTAWIGFRDKSIARQASRAPLRSVRDHLMHRGRCHLGLAVIRRLDQRGARELVSAAWLAGTASHSPCGDPSEVAPTEPTTPSADGQPLEAMSLGLTAVRQSVDELAAQLVAGQQKLAGDVARLQAAQQENLDKIPAPLPRPAAAAPRKPVPLVPPPSPPPVPR